MTGTGRMDYHHRFGSSQGSTFWLGFLRIFIFVILGTQLARTLVGAESAAPTPVPVTAPESSQRFIVQEYKLSGGASISAAAVTELLSKYTGTNVGLNEIVKAASDLQSELRKGGEYVTIAIAQER